MSKFSRFDVSAEVDLDLELSDDDVLEMARERGLMSGGRGLECVDGERWDDLEHDLRRAFADRDAQHFEVTLARIRAHAAVPELPGAPPLYDDGAPRTRPMRSHQQ